MSDIPSAPTLKSGIVTLIGRSNVGKSTLLNTLVGTKLAAVTHKPQTTRHIIHGVVNAPAGQIVFVDTPGVFKEHRTVLSQQLGKRIDESLKQIDLIVYVVDPTKSIGSEERSTLALLRYLDIPKILVVNKSDLSEKEKKYLVNYRELAREFKMSFELSALYRRHVQPLIDAIFQLLPEGEPLYPPEQLTNIDKLFWMAEIVREKIFLALRKEVPYTVHVEIQRADETPDMFHIEGVIYTYDSRYKKMIIGEGGRSIKEFSTAARKELEQALNKKVFLRLEVETDKHWMERV